MRQSVGEIPLQLPSVRPYAVQRGVIQHRHELRRGRPPVWQRHPEPPRLVRPRLQTVAERQP